MSAAQRQKEYRKKVREQGLVDVRLEVPVPVRDRIKAVAKARNSTMKREMQAALEELSRTAQL